MPHVTRPKSEHCLKLLKLVQFKLDALLEAKLTHVLVAKSPDLAMITLAESKQQEAAKFLVADNQSSKTAPFWGRFL